MFSRAASLQPLASNQFCRRLSTTASRHADFTHAVIGGGVVGLAIARQLQAREGVSTILIEKHGAVGTETSSRNSEVGQTILYIPGSIFSITPFPTAMGYPLIYRFRSSMQDYITGPTALKLNYVSVVNN